MYLLVLGNYEMQDIFKIFFKKKIRVLGCVDSCQVHFFSCVADSMSTMSV